MFIWGLSADLAVLVSQRRPSTLNEAFQLARDAALAAQMARRPGGGRNDGTGGQQSSGRRQGQQGNQQGAKSGSGGASTSKNPNVIFYTANKTGNPQNRGGGQSGSRNAPPLAASGYQSTQRQQGGSGQRGRGRGNQRRPRVAGMAAHETDQGDMEGDHRPEASQHDAGKGTEASRNQGLGN